MLKKIKNIKNVKKLDKKEQASTLGGMQFLCENICIFGFRLCYLTKTETFYQPC